LGWIIAANGTGFKRHCIAGSARLISLSDAFAVGGVGAHCVLKIDEFCARQMNRGCLHTS